MTILIDQATNALCIRAAHTLREAGRKPGHPRKWDRQFTQSDPHGRKRFGKTKADKASGAWSARFDNRRARQAALDSAKKY